MPAPISVQVYTVRDAFGADPTGTFERLRDIGFENVEGFAFVDWTDRYAAALGATGLRMPSAHASLVAVDDDQVAHTLDAAERLGIETIVDPGVGEGWDDTEGVARIAARLNAVAATAAVRGLRVGYHNHWWEFPAVGDSTGLERLAGLLDPGVVLELDVYWAAVAGMDVPHLLAGLGDRVRLLHVKDGPVEQDPASQLPAGRGETGIAAIVAAAPSATRVIEFDAYAGDIFEGVAESLRFVSALP